MRRNLIAQITVLLCLCGAASAETGGESVARVVRSRLVSCPTSSLAVNGERGAEKCLQLDVKWQQQRGNEQESRVVPIVSGPELVDAISTEFGLHASDVYDAMASYLGRLIRSKSRKRTPAIAAVDALFGAGVIRCHELLEDVSLTAAVERRVARLGHAFFREVGRPLVVTSGTRSAESQARAMYNKSRLGVKLSRFYRDEAAGEVDRAFRVARQNGLERDAIVEAGAAVIRAQVARGVYISKHLISGAVDIRSRNLSRREKYLFRRLARTHGFNVLLERKPPHFHLSIAAPET